MKIPSNSSFLMTFLKGLYDLLSTFDPLLSGSADLLSGFGDLLSTFPLLLSTSQNPPSNKRKSQAGSLAQVTFPSTI
ncbi:hypothetical protein QNH39_26750 [Neobacillus novalis]|uniref:Uncharacterized protein n=1 Tax=Neobacillus novalis TaxID=220687 RepID=A0AA95SB41_9BACI|nr:hypothetical protein [Neobacillus novalis]WHY86129.1 hypothetical protein QNH39_26750 [Neobacillus novalis]